MPNLGLIFTRFREILGTDEIEKGIWDPLFYTRQDWITVQEIILINAANWVDLRGSF